MHVLKLPTDPRWVNMAEESLEDILSDHAYCELKAATTCISLIQLYPDKIELVHALSPIVTEEWEHFQQVLEHITKRKLKLGRQRKDEYVNKLYGKIRKGGSREDQMLEKLLVAALIEARSSERFRILSKDLLDKELKLFYKELMISETGHFRLFLDIALKYHPKEKVMNRWEEYLHMESEIISSLTLRGDRIH